MAGHSYSPKAHSKATIKYVKKNLDRIEMRVTKESNLKTEIFEHSDKMGESVNAFLKRAVIETIERDNAKEQASQKTS
ncbi:MAG: hypothetical protein LUC92_03435 [Clostridiales bacterium]|nr:hypothetical protein [Clostridiales bacterium]